MGRERSGKTKSAEEPGIRCDFGPHHATIVLNQPQSSNAIGPTMADGLEIAFNELQKKKVLHAFLTASYEGQKKRVFCAGGDLKYYASLKTKSQGMALNKRMTKLLNSVQNMQTIVAAVVDGKCIGGGCEIILACDWILATDRASFQFGQSRVGLTPGWGGAQRLLRRVRPSVALEWLLSGRTIWPEEALRVGLIDQVVPAELLSGIKKLINEPSKEAVIFEKLWWSESHLERLKAFCSSGSSKK
jgi:enoyl-CoA hydratase